MTQRGPYCYTCDGIESPENCRHITKCQVDEHCLLYSKPHIKGIPGPSSYTGLCDTESACHALREVNVNTECPAFCCPDDFCNDRCFENTTSTTTYNTTATTEQAECPQNHIYDSASSACIQLVETSKFTFHEAQAFCKSIGDQLIIIDTHDKSVFVDYVLLHEAKEPLSAQNYWIGAHAINATSGKYYQWLNGQNVTFENWDRGEPDPLDHHQRCVMIMGPKNYRWHDLPCTHRAHTICERPLNSHTTPATFSASTSTTQTSTSTSTTSTTTTTRTTATTPTTTTTTTRTTATTPTTTTTTTRTTATTPTTTMTTTAPSTTTKVPVHCPANNEYTLFEEGDTHLCVHLSHSHASWKEAKSSCVHDHHGRLVVLDTKDKWSLMRHHLGDHYYWVGATNNNFHHFTWLNGAPFGSYGWDDGQPNGDHCVVFDEDHKRFHDKPCHDDFRYICEIPL